MLSMRCTMCCGCGKSSMQGTIKRLIDIGVGLGLLVLTLPLWGLIAIIIRLDSPGPAFYRQTRIGRFGRPFVMWKFRTMYQASEGLWIPPKDQQELETFVFQQQNDSRVTRVGRWLRTSSLDELPQLWNVVRGEMSLVGPRPEIPEMVALYSPVMHERHRMRPGITGLAQVSGRSELTTGEIIRFDLEYCKHWSLKLDVIILWKTLGSVLTQDRAR